jgi:hypothetical protein
VTLQRGAFVEVTAEGRTVRAMVILASPNGRSLMLMFDGMLGGYAGTLPLFLDDDGIYRGLVDQMPVTIAVTL